MRWPSDFYNRRKNPWIGFVLVMLLGPFGFLYHSWKTAVVVLLIVGPLWIEFLRTTRFDLIENPWAHYTALLVCAGFASLQIKAHNEQIRAKVANPNKADGILETAISVLPMSGPDGQAIPLKVVAASMAQVALMPLESPSEEDLKFREQAVGTGVDQYRFTLEVIALQAFAMTAAVNRERVEGRLALEKVQILVREFLLAVHKRLVETSTYDLLRLGLDPDEAFEVFSNRAEQYSRPGWGHGTIQDIPRFFAEFCGFPDSATLQQIGSYLVFVRGDLSGDWLRSIKIV